MARLGFTQDHVCVCAAKSKRVNPHNNRGVVGQGARRLHDIEIQIVEIDRWIKCRDADRWWDCARRDYLQGFCKTCNAGGCF